MSENPYAAPLTTTPLAAAQETEVEQIRRQYLKHEASVQSIGLLYCLGGILGVIIALAAAISIAEQSPMVAAILGLFIIGIGIFQFIVGIGLRRLQPWTKVPTGILSVIGLLVFPPIGTIINAYILYLVFCKKSTMVFSDYYKQIIAQTPHIKYKTSIIIWIFVVLVLMMVGISMVAAILQAGK